MPDQNDGTGQGVRASNSRGDVGSIEAFYFSFLETVRNSVIEDTRYFFATHPRVASKFQFVGTAADPQVGIPLLQSETDVRASKIRIAGGYSDNERLHPEILVLKVNANVNDLFLGQKMGSLYKDVVVGGVIQSQEVGERLGGQLTVKVGLKVQTVGGGPQELDQICDTLLYGLVSPIRRRLQQRRLVWVPNSCSFGDDREEPYTNSQKLFTRDVSFSVIADWYDDFYFDGVMFDGLVEFFKT